MGDADHVVAVRAVARSALAPPARAGALRAAREAGFVAFHGWPSGHWRLTEGGRAVLADRGESAPVDRPRPPALRRLPRPPRSLGNA